MGDIAQLATAGGLLTALVTVIGYLLVSNRADRRQYEDAIDRAEARADAAEQRVQAAWREAEEARQARHVAEDALAALRRERNGDRR